MLSGYEPVVNLDHLLTVAEWLPQASIAPDEAISNLKKRYPDCEILEAKEK